MQYDAKRDRAALGLNKSAHNFTNNESELKPKSKKKQKGGSWETDCKGELL